MYSNGENDKLKNDYVLGVEERTEVVLQDGSGIKRGFCLFV